MFVTVVKVKEWLKCGSYTADEGLLLFAAWYV